jgi:hypothetical protein
MQGNVFVLIGRPVRIFDLDYGSPLRGDEAFEQIILHINDNDTFLFWEEVGEVYRDDGLLSYFIDDRTGHLHIIKTYCKGK